KIMKSQYLMFLLADMITWVEVAKAACLKAVSENAEKTLPKEFSLAVARLFARETVEKVYINALKILKSSQEIPDKLAQNLNSLDLNSAFEGYLKDMDLVANELVA
ncbi:MAG TPA: acyl-CoA dehydrogenase family protein, partial [Desulfatiglandales bacterium]|nr:acyl-CoA dehydrogenase family protein [Desulfatiglandales bacterium]